MSPRPRKASDEEVFAAAYRVMQRLGPAQLTLAEIAAEAGLTAGALVQRFGSKRELMLQLMEQLTAATPAMYAELRAKHRSPLAAIRAYAAHMAAMAESPASLAHHLSYLQLDFTDPDFHRHARTQAQHAHAALRAIVEEAIAAGELAPATNADALARLIGAVTGGSMLAWGFFREGTAARWIRRDLEEVLKPWRV